MMKFSKSADRTKKNAQRTGRNGQDVNRRNFLRLESLESRLALTTLAAVNDAFHTGIDQPLNISGPGVLANDVSGSGQAMTAALFSGPAHGTLTFNTDGSFLYTPATGFNGQDSFVYTANDGFTNSLLAAVTIDVSEGTAPVSADDWYSLSEDQTLLMPAVTGLLANDSSAADATVEIVSGPASGVLEAQPDGGFVYTPEANYSGEVTFTYRATNAMGVGNEATVTLSIAEVNDVPVATNDSFSVDEDQPLTVTTSVMSNDFDVEGSPLTASLASQPMHGTVTFNPDGTFSYQAEANYNGIDGFSYWINDGADNSEVATVTISVNPVNDLPTAGNDEFTVAEDAVLHVDAANGVLSNDSDIDGDTLTATIVAQPEHGTVTLNADGSFVYTPAADYNGVDGFSYLADDGLGNSNVASVTINVTPVNDPPVAVNDEYTVAEDTELTVEIPGVLLNDLDPDSTVLSTTLVNPPQYGTVTLGSDGTLVYMPAADFNGMDGFSYTVSDGELTSAVASVTINVTPVNDAPIGVADAYEIAEDNVLTIVENGVLANDIDVDSTNLTAVMGTPPTNGTVVLNSDGTFTYTPNADFAGEDSFTYTTSDGELSGAETTVTITVTAVNDGPTSVADAYEITEDSVLSIFENGVLANDIDVDGPPLTATLGAAPTNGTVVLNSDGTFEYTPNADFAGEDSFTYFASDGENIGSETTVTITVVPENDKPFAEDDAYSVDENQTLTIDPAGVLANDSDIDGDSLTAEIVTGPTNGTLTLAADGSFVYTPNPGFAGTDTFTYAAFDGTDAATAVVTITVNDVIQPPTANGDAYNTAEDTPLNINAAWGVLANDFDPQGETLTATIVTPPQHGTLTLNADGSFAYTPDADYHGPDSFVYRATNASGEATEGTASIVVQTVNDAPNAGDDSFTVAAGGTLTTTAATGVMANDTDIDSTSLTANLLQGPAHGTLVFNADGSFTYTPNAGYVGADEFIYQLNDGMANSNVAHASIAVTPAIQLPNGRPNVVNDHYVLTADAPFTVEASGILANDSDPQGDALMAYLFGGPQHGTVVLNTDGSFTYTPQAGYIGTDSFLYWATDGALNSQLAAVTLVIEAGPSESPELILGEDGAIDENAFDCVLTGGLWA